MRAKEQNRKIIGVIVTMLLFAGSAIYIYFMKEVEIIYRSGLILMCLCIIGFFTGLLSEVIRESKEL